MSTVINFLIDLNGKPYPVQPETTVAQLLMDLKISQTAIAVELNADILSIARFAHQILQPGDRIEIVTMVGGG